VNRTAARTHRPATTGWPVADAAGRIGVSVSTLHSWERRYGLGPTARTPGGHRRYTADDIARLQRLQRLVERGVPTAEAAAAASEPPTRHQPLDDATDLDRHTARLCSAADALDVATTFTAARTVLRRRGVVAAWTDVFVPALRRAGQRWERTGRGVDCEHVLSDAVAAALRRYTNAHRPPSAPRVLLAATPGEGHTLPLDALAAGLADHGIASCVLGTLPGVDLFAAAERVRPAVAVLWARTSAATDVGELGELCRRVALTCAAGEWPEVGAPVTRDLGSTIELLRAWLRADPTGTGRDR
jgi:DNA-binding transcriptional MerR regulator